LPAHGPVRAGLALRGADRARAARRRARRSSLPGPGGRAGAPDRARRAAARRGGVARHPRDGEFPGMVRRVGPDRPDQRFPDSEPEKGRLLRIQRLLRDAHRLLLRRRRPRREPRLAGMAPGDPARRNRGSLRGGGALVAPAPGLLPGPGRRRRGPPHSPPAGAIRRSRLPPETPPPPRPDNDLRGTRSDIRLSVAGATSLTLLDAAAILLLPAKVAELVDAQVSGTCG